MRGTLQCISRFSQTGLSRELHEDMGNLRIKLHRRACLCVVVEVFRERLIIIIIIIITPYTYYTFQWLKMNQCQYR